MSGRVDTSENLNDFTFDGRLVKLSTGRTVRRSLETSNVETRECFSD